MVLMIFFFQNSFISEPNLEVLSLNSENEVQHTFVLLLLTHHLLSGQ